MGATWTDLLDPDREALEQVCPCELHPRAVDRLLAPAERGEEPRPTLEAHTNYVFGVFLVAVFPVIYWQAIKQLEPVPEPRGRARALFSRKLR